ncbi:hypothetical protein [Pseudomonas helleri]|uniref:hypothetical protein n=1 Tax=Pseudomonas helleri TaxID=1608996 RepID=UPI003F96114B
MVKRIGLGLVLLVLCAFAALVALGWMFFAVLGSSTRAWRLAVSFDQLANTAFGGSEDETISSRAGKAARKGKRWGCVLCRLLDWFEPNHCEGSIEMDEGKMSA